MQNIDDKMIELVSDYKLSPIGLIDLYAKKQYDYAKREIDKGVDIDSTVKVDELQQRAINSIYNFAKRKGYDAINRIVKTYD